MTKIFFSSLLIVVLTACSTTPSPSPTVFDASSLPEIVPTAEPPSRTGNPRTYEVFGKRYTVSGTSEGYRQQGIASWYGQQFHGRRTSSGPAFDMYAVTAAHKSLPIPTYVRVTRLDNGRSIIVKVNDRGPFVGDRIIDLSYAAAAKLDMVNKGTAPVEVVALAPYQYLPGFPYDNPNGQLAAAEPEARVPVRINQRLPAPAASDYELTPTFSIAHPPVAEAAFTTQTGAQPDTVYLQVGAFAARQNAEELQHHLQRSLGRPVKVDSTAGSLHKVRVGPLTGKADLEQTALRLTGLGVATPRVVIE